MNIWVMTKGWNSPKLRDAVMMTIIATAVIAILFSWLAAIICIASGIIIIVLFFVFIFMWETVDIEYDAKVIAKEMTKINVDKNTGWKELLLHGDFKVLALRKGPKTAAIIFFLIYFGPMIAVFAISYILYPKNDIYIPIVFLLSFGSVGFIRAYAKEKTYELAIKRLEKGEADEYHEPEPTFWMEGER